jgi:hypothetical protein
MAELRIPIIGENKSKKAFDQVGSATSKLEKSVKKLGGVLAATFGAQQLLKFAKNASMAFIEDQKAANQLAIAVKNLGLAFETPSIERFISDLSKMSGVTDDQLRPSMQKLLQTTGSVAKSTELLTQALDISAGSGIDYETVVSDLSAAYVGNVKGLKKYSLGLTNAELKAMTFAQVQEKLNQQFSGANAAYLTTYAGKLQLITTAAGEASEKIGGALVESLVSVFAAGDTTQFVNQIDTLATKIADTVAAVVFGFQKLYVLTSDRAILASFNPFDDYEKNALAAIDAAEKAAKFKRNMPSMGYQGSQPMGIYETPVQAAARKKAEADAAKRAKELAALQKNTLDTQKKQNALTKASKTLNLEAIGIEAALKGKISETDRLSLLLQKAILEGNATLATQLSDQLEAAITRQNEIRALLLTTPEAPNPYRNWTLPLELLNYTASSLGVSVAQLQAAPVMPDSNFSDAQMELVAAYNAATAAENKITEINLYLDSDLIGKAVSDSQQNSSLSGSFNQINRGNNKGAVAL